MTRNCFEDVFITTLGEKYSISWMSSRPTGVT